jgi:hypothetical protein
MARTNKIIKAPETMGELRTELLKVFADLRNGDINLNEAAECNNTAGKIINSVKIEVEVYALMKKDPAIKFIEGPG